MRGYQHATSAVYTILHNNEVELAGKLVFVYTVQAALLWRAAHAIALR